MEPTESFSLRWDDFEANTRVALKELREERDFCDVTLATDGKQVSAHKVILAGGSKFFQQILKQNPHPHPLIYLKGVRYEYLLSMLDFLYTGEANINEKELVSFLDVAEDLQIKGLIVKNPSRKTSAEEGETIPGNVSHQDQLSDVKKEAGPLLHTETPFVNIKVELDEKIHSTEQSLDFSDDASRPNSGKLAPVFTSPDQLVEDDNDKTKPGITSSFHFNFEEDSSYVERDDFLSGVDDKVQVFLTQRESVKSVSKNEDVRNAHCWYEEVEKYVEPVDNHNDNELSTMKRGRKFCSVCQKSVRDNFALNEHMRTHRGEKRFPCSFCPKTFDNSSQIKEHTMTHTGEKPFPCSFCPKTFRNSSHLKAHTRIHTGEKPFQCLVCFKSFNQSSALNVHKKRCYMKPGE